MYHRFRKNIKVITKYGTALFTLTLDLLSTRLLLAIINLRNVFRFNKKAFYIITSLSTLYLIILLYFSFTNLFTPIINKGNTYPSHSSTRYVLDRGDSQPNPIVNSFIDVYENAINLIKPTLDNFVGSTPDMTGYTSTDDHIDIGYGKILSASSFYKKTANLAYSVLGILLLVEMINLASAWIKSEKILEDSFDIVKRIFFVVIAISLGRYALSYIVQLNNAVNNFFTNGGSLTDYLIHFLDSIKTGSNSNPFIDYMNSVFAITTFDFKTMIEAFPVVFIFLCDLILILFVAFQFTMRFISLYFLVSIFPLVCIFLISKEGSKVFKNFLRSWFTFLIHQPAFVFGFTIMTTVLGDGLSYGPTWAAFLIFLASLFYLSQINIQVSRIFTEDVWTAIGSNVLALAAGRKILQGAGVAGAVGMGGAGLVASNFKSLGNQIKEDFFGNKKEDESGIEEQGVNMVGGEDSSVPEQDISPLLTGTIKKVAHNSPSVKEETSTKIPHHKELEDLTNSIYAQKLKKLGYTVEPNQKANGINLSGTFWRKSNNNGISTLYTSKQDAFENGVEKSQLSKVDLGGNTVLDTINFGAKSAYNTKLTSLANKKHYKGDVHIDPRSDPKRVMDGMSLAKDQIVASGIEGILIERFGDNAPKDKSQFQIHIYDDFLDK